MRFGFQAAVFVELLALASLPFTIVAAKKNHESVEGFFMATWGLFVLGIIIAALTGLWWLAGRLIG